MVSGPVSPAFSSEHARALLHGMQDIFGNAVGFTTVPTTEQVIEVAASFAIDDLLAQDTNSPMLVINGDEDVHVPLADTTVFDGRPDTDVQLVRGGAHCAFNKARRAPRRHNQVAHRRTALSPRSRTARDAGPYRCRPLESTSVVAVLHGTPRDTKREPAVTTRSIETPDA
ncbi:hypothetical protein Acsp06_54050 [Actinomycetospora sp. NBRC 106375]|uniref:hypothetical protein n=1 Tax=Actinomycetospora sp. NBRC 106375 TaxID=3032207 RepID=UPI0024A50D72|nr:hypothetical protein [Actinomycetospora sp. NBRC 106375]GLZ49220.1 hypothetical protein Acsp06_54050 [Actinomycetospora sp. NBRC 106375]